MFRRSTPLEKLSEHLKQIEVTDSDVNEARTETNIDENYDEDDFIDLQ